MNGPIETNEMTQLVYYDLTLNDTFQDHIRKCNFDKVGKDYNTIAIIGCQSSGKSTLLNGLFDTNFEVMDPNKGRGQTTKGIWVAMDSRHRVLILDCEGTDSKERGEDRHKFEHCSSLFALALADVLVINMWTNDVGRYTASNYGVLKIVFEMNLKLFQQECAKKIFIVLRDFDERINIKERIQELILKDIEIIWNDIRKPEKYKDTSPQNFFEFEFTTLPHKYYCEAQFNAEIVEMRKRLSINDPNYLFKHVASNKTVPSDGLSQYCSQVWSAIISEKDLNIPSQKEMLANYRCNEIKEEALGLCAEQIKELQHSSQQKILSNFKEKSSEILDIALKKYDETASNYIEHVYQDIRKQLIISLSQQLYVCFANQAKKLIPISQKNLRNDLENQIKLNDNFFETALRLKKAYLSNLVKKLEDIRLFENWEISIEEYGEMFDEIIENQRKICLDEKKAETIKKLKNQIEDSLLSKLEDLSPNFWEEFNGEYINYFFISLLSLKTFLMEYYKMEEDEYIEYAKEIENEVYQSVKSEFARKLKEISSFAIDLFKKKFWYENGIPRIWNRMEESDIDSLYKQYKNETADLFENFRHYLVLRNPLKYTNYQTASSVNINEIISNVPAFLEKEKQISEIFFKSDEIHVMKKKYEEGVSQILEDAKRRQASIFKQNLPWWGWALIIFFGYDDVLRLMQTYWIIPIIILLSLYGTLSALGLSHIPRNLFYIVQDLIIRRK